MEPFPKKELHPLLNPLILGKIFEDSKVKDLKTYRQVSRAWLECTSKAMRESAGVVIRSSREGQNGLKGLEAFMALMENEVSTFTSHNFPRKVTLSFGLCNVPRFWTLYGGQLKSIKLDNVTFLSASDFREAVFLSCPNLEDLTISMLQENKSRGPEQNDDIAPLYPENRKLKSLKWCNVEPKKFGLSWMEVFSRSPCLEKLHLWGNDDIQLDDAFKALRIIRGRDIQNCNLKELRIGLIDLRQPLEMAMAAIMTDGNIALEILEIGGILPREEQVLRMMLQGHASTLAKLSLGHVWWQGRERQDIFPLTGNAVLGNLQEAELRYDPFQSMGFLKFVPSLRKLFLDYTQFSMIRNTHLTEMGNFALGSVEELKITVMGWVPVELEDVRRLSTWLPNVRKLLIEELSNETLSLVCQSWPNLTSIVVRLTGALIRVDDCGVTGLDVEDVERINRDGGTGNWNPITVPRASITSMKYLQRLVISSLRHLDISYSSLRGIQSLPKLQQLMLHWNGMDKDTWNPLLAQFPWKWN